MTNILGAEPAPYSSPQGYQPDQIRGAYGITGTGAGQTIAIVDAYDDPNIYGDLDAFDARFGTASNGLASRAASSFLTKYSLPGTTAAPKDPSGTLGGWGIEISMDVEWAHALAPQANILLVEAPNAFGLDQSGNPVGLLAAIDYARKQPGVSVVSMSFSLPEAALAAAGISEQVFDSYFTTPGGHTPVTFVAATGDSGAYENIGTPSNPNYVLTVSYPAASPNVLAVGGSVLTVGPGNSYSSESGWTLSGGGVSAQEGQPSYQAGQTGYSNRTIPDVSFDAGGGVSVYDSYDPGPGSSTNWYDEGGTSFGTPAWAALVAEADRIRSSNGLSPLDGPTQTLPAIYSLPQGDFHDIADNTSNGAYSATAGYDLVTGRGTPIANTLVPDLAAPWRELNSSGAPFFGPTVDAKGDLFVQSYYGGVYEIPQGSSPNHAVEINSGYYSNFIVADPKGDLFVANSSGVWEIPAGAPFNYMIQLSSVSYAGAAVADANGNLFVQTVSPGGLYEIPAGAPNGTRIALNSQYWPELKADAKGNLYVASSQGVFEIPAGSPYNYTVQLSSVGSFQGMTVDAKGDVFVESSSFLNQSAVYMIPAGSPNSLEELFTGFYYSMTADAAGNLYVASSTGAVYEFKYGSFFQQEYSLFAPPGLNSPQLLADAAGDLFVLSAGVALWEYN